VVTRNTNRHSQDLAPVVADLIGNGCTSLRAMASELKDRSTLNRRGGCWHKSMVMILLDRLGLGNATCDGRTQHGMLQHGLRPSLDYSLCWVAKKQSAPHERCGCQKPMCNQNRSKRAHGASPAGLRQLGSG
jgi:hypothetical protein